MTHIPTIKDVAHLAGVHFTTVSMALRGDPRLRPETRDRIFAAVARVGYRRTALSGALGRSRTAGGEATISPRIALVANRSFDHGLTTLTYFRRMEQDARKHAEALGYGFEVLFVDQDYHDSQSLYRYLKDNGVKGVIICAFEPTRRDLELPWEEFGVVKIDSRHMPPACTFVSNDQLFYVRLAFRKLRALGYRRIGLAIGASDEVATDGLHVCGLQLEQASVPPCERVEPLLFPSAARDAEVKEVLGPWIRRESVDVVMSNWTSIPRLMTNMGIRCPQDVAYACLCMSRKTSRSAGVLANLGEVGRQVIGLLVASLRSERYGLPESPTSTYVRGTWCDGASAPQRG